MGIVVEPEHGLHHDDYLSYNLMDVEEFALVTVVEHCNYIFTILRVKLTQTSLNYFYTMMNGAQ